MKVHGNSRIARFWRDYDNRNHVHLQLSDVDEGLSMLDDRPEMFSKIFKAVKDKFVTMYVAHSRVTQHDGRNSHLIASIRLENWSKRLYRAYDMAEDQMKAEK